MKNSFLDFEKPIADIYDKIQALKDIVNESPELLPQIAKLEEEENKDDDIDQSIESVPFISEPVKKKRSRSSK